MNWILVIVLLVILACAMHGYSRGFLRMVYSLVSWIIVLAFVSWATPYVDGYIRENTAIYEKVETYCEETVQRSVQEQIDGVGTEQQGQLPELGLNLPEPVMQQITGVAAGMTGIMLEESGAYSRIAESLADFITEGLASVIVFIAAGILMHTISMLLGIVSRIPVLKGVNRFTGMIAGILQGLLIVWAAFFVIALCSAGQTGQMLVASIYESPFLTSLYENNILLSLGMGFLG